MVAVVLIVAFVRCSPTGRRSDRRSHYALRRVSHRAPVVAAVLLAYPLWFLLRGPAHLTGPIWSIGSLSHFGNSLTSSVDGRESRDRSEPK